MADSAEARNKPIAGPAHTIFLMVVLAIWAWHGARTMIRMGDHPRISLLRTYLLSSLFEWLVVAYVAFGIRRKGASLRLLIGGSWAKGRDILIDIALAFGCWFIIFTCMIILGLALQVGGVPKFMRLLAPATPTEIAGWMLLALTAGFCEEVIFRGYLQRQFIAVSRNVPFGVALSAVLFGGMHLYQGPRRAVLLIFFGAALGTLAELRQSLRPAMILHAWQDTLAGLLIRLLPK